MKKQPVAYGHRSHSDGYVPFLLLDPRMNRRFTAGKGDWNCRATCGYQKTIYHFHTYSFCVNTVLRWRRGKTEVSVHKAQQLVGNLGMNRSPFGKKEGKRKKKKVRLRLKIPRRRRTRGRRTLCARRRGLDRCDVTGKQGGRNKTANLLPTSSGWGRCSRNPLLRRPSIPGTRPRDCCRPSTYFHVNRSCSL